MGRAFHIPYLCFQSGCVVTSLPKLNHCLPLIIDSIASFSDTVCAPRFENKRDTKKLQWIDRAIAERMLELAGYTKRSTVLQGDKEAIVYRSPVGINRSNRIRKAEKMEPDGIDPELLKIARTANPHDMNSKELARILVGLRRGAEKMDKERWKENANG